MSSYKSNYKIKNTQHSKYHEIRLKPLTIDDNLYLMSLVCTGEVDALVKLVKNNQRTYELNFNCSFRLPIQDVENIVEEVNQLLDTDKCFYGVEDFIRRNRMMRRLMGFYNIQQLKSGLFDELQTEDYFSAESASTSYSSSVGCSYDEGIFMAPRHQDENIDEIVNDSITHNKLFDLTFMHVAILLENHEMIRFLLRNECGIGALKANRIHAVHVALHKANTSILSVLLTQLSDENGALDKLTDDRGFNPLQVAILHANEEAVELLCSHGANVNGEIQGGNYPLIWALENVEAPYRIVLKLLEFGANPNIVNNTHGYTPLIVATLADRSDLIHLLCKYGADVNKIIENEQACCALQVAIDRSQQTNNFDSFNSLLKAGANPTFYKETQKENAGGAVSGPLIDAISMNNKYMVEMLLRYGANPHTDVNGTYSPMCTACFMGHYEIVELLLQHKVDPVWKCKNSNSPLTVAVSMNHDRVVNLLMLYYSTKEAINAQDANGDHALLYAALNRKPKLVKDLLKKGAEADLENKFNATALWYSIYNNDSESFHALLPLTKDFNKASNGVEYNNFEFTPELIYRTSVAYVELADEKDFYEAIYFLKLRGAHVSQTVTKNLIIKYRNLNYAVKAKIIEATPKAADTLRRLKSLVHFLCTPLNLTRLCRLALKNNSSLSTAPMHLEEFMSFKKM